MEEPDINTHFLKQNLFELFKEQLIKDFESSGISVDFAVNLPADFNALKSLITQQIQYLEQYQSNRIPILLYRIDITEAQIKKYSHLQPELSYQALLSELIIKRILQKIILKKTYSK